MVCRHLDEQQGYVAVLAGELELALELAVEDEPDDVLAHAKCQFGSLRDGGLAVAGGRDRPGAVEQPSEDCVQVSGANSSAPRGPWLSVGAR